MYTIGINHKTAPISIREQLFLTPTEQQLFLCELRSNPSVIEAFVLSTCNRTEAYIRRLEGTEDLSFLINLILKIKKIDQIEDLTKYCYIYENNAAVRHLLNVACSLDSLVIGEKQILGQVKNAVERAREAGMLGKVFNVLTNTAIRAGKKAQTETDISAGGSSVSWAAVATAERCLETLSDKSILIIGAGKMGEVSLKQIISKNPKQIYLMNRTGSKAQELADKYQGEAVDFTDTKDVLTEVDLCICSVGAPHYVINQSLIQKVMPKRNNKPLLLIDISMPRNIDPLVVDVSGVTLRSIDDLDKIVQENMQRREKAIDDVKNIVDQKEQEFHTKMIKTSLGTEFSVR